MAKSFAIAIASLLLAPLCAFAAFQLFVKFSGPAYGSDRSIAVGYGALFTAIGVGGLSFLIFLALGQFLLPAAATRLVWIANGLAAGGWLAFYIVQAASGPVELKYDGY